MIIKRIDYFSCGKVLGATYALMGVILGAIFSLSSIVGIMAQQKGNDGIGPMLFGLGAIIVLPVLYGLMGFIGGIVASAIYNFVASFIGGIELEVELSNDGSRV